MTALPFAFQTNQSKYAFAGEAQLINAYAEQQGSDAKDPLAVLPAYGMTLERTVTDTPQRGAIYLDDLDCIYTVHATSVYCADADQRVVAHHRLPAARGADLCAGRSRPIC